MQKLLLFFTLILSLETNAQFQISLNYHYKLNQSTSYSDSYLSDDPSIMTEKIVSIKGSYQLNRFNFGVEIGDFYDHRTFSSLRVSHEGDKGPSDYYYHYTWTSTFSSKIQFRYLTSAFFLHYHLGKKKHFIIGFNVGFQTLIQSKMSENKRYNDNTYCYYGPHPDSTGLNVYLECESATLSSTVDKSVFNLTKISPSYSFDIGYSIPINNRFFIDFQLTTGIQKNKLNLNGFTPNRIYRFTTSGQLGLKYTFLKK